MADLDSIVAPSQLQLIKQKTRALGFTMACEDSVGALLRTLAASKRGGRLLELGTGTGVGTAWLVDGMDMASKLTTVDISAEYQQVAREAFVGDGRLEILTLDAAEFLGKQPPGSFDLVFADAMPGKFVQLDKTKALLQCARDRASFPLIPQRHDVISSCANTCVNSPYGDFHKFSALITTTRGQIVSKLQKAIL